MFGSDLPSLHQLVDPDVLPAEFGGSSTDTGMHWFEAQVKVRA